LTHCSLNVFFINIQRCFVERTKNIVVCFSFYWKRDGKLSKRQHNNMTSTRWQCLAVPFSTFHALFGVEKIRNEKSHSWEFFAKDAWRVNIFRITFISTPGRIFPLFDGKIFNVCLWSFSGNFKACKWILDLIDQGRALESDLNSGWVRILPGISWMFHSFPFSTHLSHSICVFIFHSWTVTQKDEKFYFENFPPNFHRREFSTNDKCNLTVRQLLICHFWTRDFHQDPNETLIANYLNFKLPEFDASVTRAFLMSFGRFLDAEVSWRSKKVLLVFSRKVWWSGWNSL
jgi:hypothetical protein